MRLNICIGYGGYAIGCCTENVESGFIYPPNNCSCFHPYKTKFPWVRRLPDNGACTGTGG